MNSLHSIIVIDIKTMTIFYKKNCHDCPIFDMKKMSSIAKQWHLISKKTVMIHISLTFKKCHNKWIYDIFKLSLVRKWWQLFVVIQ